VGLPSPSNINFQAPDNFGSEFFTKKVEAFSSQKIFGELKSVLFSDLTEYF
tara:strand:+ start:58 stop:210 length:153 start_codon:yes stop_codon:yes gene_type:complete